MAIETAGFQGTVSESQWAEIAKGFGQKYTLVDGPAVRSSGRTVYVDPRASVGAGVLVKNTTVESLTVPAPATGTGQWHLVALRRTWGTSRGAAYTLIPGLAGTNAAQTTPPATFPAARNKQVGLLDDEPVAWAYARSGTSTLQLWQLSARPSAVVPGVWALWDPLEQGFMVAWSEADTSEYVYRGGAWVVVDKAPIVAHGSFLMPGASPTFQLAFPPGRFRVAPTVLLNPITSDPNFVAYATGASPTGATINYARTSNTNILWIAVQEP